MSTCKHFLTNLFSLDMKFINFYDEMTGLVDKGRAVVIIYLDISRAFNTVSREIFTKKVMKYGLDEKTEWIENWPSPEGADHWHEV